MKEKLTTVVMLSVTLISGSNAKTAINVVQ